MERLTDATSGLPIDQDGGLCVTAKFIRRLAAYEDILFDADGNDRISLSRLSEICSAEKDGRVVVLPCKVGIKLMYDGFEWDADHWNIHLTAFRKANTKVGYTVHFFSPEEAEAALGGGGG